MNKVLLNQMCLAVLSGFSQVSLTSVYCSHKLEQYVNRIKLIINRTKEEYANDETVDPSLLWEMVKMKVREESIKFDAHKKKKIAEKQEEIEQSVAFLEKILPMFLQMMR